MKTWKKVLAFALAAGMSLSLLAGCGTTSTGGDTGTPAPSGSTAPSESVAPSGEQTASFTTVEEGKLHMSTNATFPPYEMTTDDGGFEGIDVEVAQAIADKLGLELVVDDMGFDAALTAVQTGQSDIAMAGITVTDERLEVMDFSDSYATGVQVVIVKEDSPIQSLDDLANADMIGCQAATTGYIYASDTPENGGYGEDHVTAYDSGALAVMALVNDQIDAVIIDNEPAKAFVEQYEGLKILETPWVEEEYAIGFAKGNTALLDAVNAAMAELKAEGTFQAIVDKYITAE
ncbi:MAG: transporter substrate-binding domain-containing protein [Pseudoflavonifractor capillosus]|uniref:transporter substrate-binding domain-containing protein n=1 Tax=Pseudoflavonifractor capillosus TaxID=106588 RepID=UPI0023F83F5A|nr:transporter substrate-binding domain-containing protein [Pseudoflavonifractor capillosus]MCI5927286.1 transporter substrate-binding domain-containing protein [Pseudoflavonifractor capillosus]MDY4660694.1 transporter substrate-binding domain-containing protein [Pseudoflavonifractor capillosus]